MDDSVFLSIRDYANAVWRRRWFFMVFVLTASAVGFLYSSRQPNEFRSIATLMYQPPVDSANPLADTYVDPTVREAALSSVGGVLTSATVRAAAEEAAGVTPAPYTVTSEIATSESTGGTETASSNLVLLSVDSTRPSESALLANVYANAFTDWSREQQQARISQAKQAVKELKKGLYY